MKIRTLKIALMGAALAGAMSASASLVTSPGGASFNNTPPPGVEGFAFTTGAANTTWNMLGIYDWGNDGLAASHVVTLFDSLGHSLVSATINAGGGSTADSFQWVSIAPVTLSANTQYVLGASYGNSDPDWFYYGTATLPTGFTLDGSVYADQNGNPGAFPGTLYTAGTGFFGPNLSAVPEPTTVVAGVLLLLPFGASTLRILRKSRTA